jgi:parallel beta-helix repeat protein
MELAHGRTARRAATGARNRLVAGVVAVAVALAAIAALLSSGGGSHQAAEPRERLGPAAGASVLKPAAPRIPSSGSGLRYVAANGSDAAPGTRSRPWRTIKRAVAAAAPGMTIVLRRGVYGGSGQFIDVTASGTAGAPITFIGQKRPKVIGAFVVDGDHVRVRGIVFAGPTGRVYDRDDELGGEADQVTVTGDAVEISNCEIRNNRGHAGIFLNEAERVRIMGNYIHHNGNFGNPAQANLDHGIYFGSGSGVIANNVVENNYAFGVHLYPQPHDVLVTHNTIVGNGRSGVIVANDSTNIRVVNNIIARNAQRGVSGYELTGTHNVVENNLFWANRDDAAGGGGLTLIDNRSGNPRFLARSDYRLRHGGPALARGIRLGKVSQDFRGRERPRNARADLGAFQTTAAHP